MLRRHFARYLFVIAVVLVMRTPTEAQSPAISHARQILESLKQERFKDVAAEFSTQMAAAISVEQLGMAWSGIQSQFGGFKSVIDEQESNPQPNITLVTIGCQFEKADLNMLVAFDGESKIAGLRFAPRPK